MNDKIEGIIHRPFAPPIGKYELSKKSIEQYGSNYFGNTLDGSSNKNPFSGKDLEIFYSSKVGIFGESIYPIIWETP